LDTAKFRRDLLEMQQELQRFAYKLTADKEEANDLLQETSLKALGNMDKYTPDTNFKGWVYTIMRNIFINNYRKEVRDQTFVDHTDNLFHINQPREAENYTTENNYDSKEIYRIVHSLPRDYHSIPYAPCRVQIPRDSRPLRAPFGHCKEPDILYTTAAPTPAERLQVIHKTGNLFGHPSC